MAAGRASPEHATRPSEELAGHRRPDSCLENSLSLRGRENSLVGHLYHEAFRKQGNL